MEPQSQHCAVKTEMCLFKGNCPRQKFRNLLEFFAGGRVFSEFLVGGQVHFMDGIRSTPAKKSLLLIIQIQIQIQRIDGTVSTSFLLKIRTPTRKRNIQAGWTSTRKKSLSSNSQIMSAGGWEIPPPPPPMENPLRSV